LKDQEGALRIAWIKFEAVKPGNDLPGFVYEISSDPPNAPSAVVAELLLGVLDDMKRRLDEAPVLNPADVAEKGL
jgi:hypothetical protein